MLGGFEKALVGILVLVLMLGMGATLTAGDFRRVARHPRGVLIGLASQFGWMPLIAYALSKGLGLPQTAAVGLVLVGCTPGGTTSNLYAYWSKADVALSVSMTTVSNAVAVVAMPLLLFVYARPFTDANLQIPYGEVAKTLVAVLVPVAVGVYVRRRSERAAAVVERLGSLAGAAVLVVLVLSTMIRNPGELIRTPPLLHLAALGLGVVGMGLGYAVARVAGLGLFERRAVALETGIQNSPLAFAIILGSFPDVMVDELLRLPLIYALYVLVSAALVSVYFRRTGGPDMTVP